MFSTRMTTARDVRSDWYAKWAQRLGLTKEFCRKGWETAVVAETLESNGYLTLGKRGVGYGVGSEPLATVFADAGPDIVATDLLKPEWAHVHSGFGAHSAHSNVSTRIVDMNWIDGRSGKARIEDVAYDFSWSVCSMDHCGTAWLTKRFLLNQMNCLRLGGIGVHTAEYTVSLGLPKEGPTVWLDWSDVTDVTDLLIKLGHDAAPIDWNIGDSIEDHRVDPHPWCGTVSLKLEANAGRWASAIVFAARKTSNRTFWVPYNESEARDAIAAY